MKIALIQFNAGENKTNNLKRAIKFIKQAANQKAAFVLLPEIFVWRKQGSAGETLGKVADSLGSPTIKLLCETAKRNKIFILAGSIYEKIPGKAKTYNTSLLINPRGIIQTKYRKMNLFKACINGKTIDEGKSFLPGRALAVTRIGEFSAGLSICYDLRFPELYRKYFNRGVNVICAPSNFTKKTGGAHFEALLRARAIENMCYVLAPNQVGHFSNGVEAYGNSMVIDPGGKILARASDSKEEMVFADIDLKEINRARAVFCK